MITVNNETDQMIKGSESSGKMQALADKIHDKTSKYDANAVTDAYKGKEEIGFFKMVMRYATFKDKFFFGITVLAIFCYGGMRPVFSQQFGKVSGNVNDS